MRYFVNKIKQLILDIIYFFYSLLRKRNVREIENSDVAIVFFSHQMNNSAGAPIGEFIIREPFFRYLKNKNNKLTLITDKKDFMKLKPFDKYFAEILSLEEFLSIRKHYNFIILAQNYISLPLDKIRSRADYLLSYSHQYLFLHPSIWKHIDYFPPYKIGGEHELQRAFDVLNIKLDLSKKENWPKINYEAKSANMLSFVLLDNSNFKSLKLEDNVKIIQDVLDLDKKSKIVLLGDKNALLSAKSVCQKLRPNRIINKVGRTNALELVKILAKLKLIITPDTGTAHLAAALGRPLITYYTKTVLDRWRPLSGELRQIKISDKSDIQKIVDYSKEMLKS